MDEGHVRCNQISTSCAIAKSYLSFYEFVSTESIGLDLTSSIFMFACPAQLLYLAHFYLVLITKAGHPLSELFALMFLFCKAFFGLNRKN